MKKFLRICSILEHAFLVVGAVMAVATRGEPEMLFALLPLAASLELRFMANMITFETYA